MAGEIFDPRRVEPDYLLDERGENARHNGHADLIRELIDGRTGW